MPKRKPTVFQNKAGVIMTDYHEKKPRQRFVSRGYTVNQLMAYEEGAMTPEQEKKLFSALIKSGDAYRLQGHYGRMAQAYIESGQIDSKGRIKKKIKDMS